MIKYYEVSYIWTSPDGEKRNINILTTGKSYEDVKYRTVGFTNCRELVSIKPKSICFNTYKAFLECVRNIVLYVIFSFHLLLFSLELILNYDPEMFTESPYEGAYTERYARWVYWVSYLGRPLYWLRCLLGTRSKIWLDKERKRKENQLNSGENKNDYN